MYVKCAHTERDMFWPGYANLIAHRESVIWYMHDVNRGGSTRKGRAEGKLFERNLESEGSCPLVGRRSVGKSDFHNHCI